MVRRRPSLSGERSARRRAARWAALSLLLVLVAACRPLYLPPIPAEVPFDPGARVASFTAELDDSGRPTLQVALSGVEAAGWLNVQWMAPVGREAASESVWLEPESPEASFVLPPDVELTAGEWRALVSFGPRLLRQFRFDVEPPNEEASS